MSAVTLGILVLALVAGGLGAPLPEDTTLVMAGALSHDGQLPLPLVVGVCGLAVLCADLVLFGAARRLGPQVWSWRWLRGLVSEARQTWVATQVARYGGAAVFVARFLPGVRVVVFLVAGLHGMRIGRFVAFDVLGLCISVPLLVLVGHAVSTRVGEVVTHLHHVQLWALVVVVVGAAVLTVLRGSFNHARS